MHLYEFGIPLRLSITLIMNLYRVFFKVIIKY